MTPPSHRHDVIVAGARRAGSPLAMLLARGGCRGVPRLDRATFPCAKLSTHHIQQPGVVLLLKALRERQPETDRLFGTLSGTTRILNFYSSANLLRLAVAGCSEPGRAARAA